VYAVLLQHARRLDAFPGGSHLDQHPLLGVDAFGAVQRRDAPAACDGAGRVERQPGIDLGRHATRNQRQDLRAETHQQAVDHLVQGFAVMLFDGFIEQRSVLRLLHRFQDERRIGRRVLRLEGGDLVEITGVCDDGGPLAEGIELVHERIIRRCFAAVDTFFHDDDPT